jgi:hypothetical protein
VVFKEGDPLPPALLSKLKSSQYEMESGFDLIPLEYQQGSTTTTTDRDANVSTTQRDNLSNPKVNKLGRIFVPEGQAAGIYSSFLQQLAKNGQSIEQVKSELSKMAGYPTSTKTGLGAYLNTKKKQAAPKTFKHD